MRFLKMGYTLDGKPLIYLSDDHYVVRECLSPASDYSPVIHAPDAQDPDNPTQEYLKGYRLICTFPEPDSVKPYYIMLSRRKGPDPDHCEEVVDIGDPVIQGEWVNVLTTYNPAGGEIEWQHSPSDPGWTGEPPFKPQAVGEHTITARYYAHPDKPAVGYVEDKVTFVVLPTPGVQLISEVPKDTLLIGERMPLTARFVSLDGAGNPESIIVDPAIHWGIVEGRGLAQTENWRELWYQAPPPGDDQTESWFTGTITGIAEGTVKIQAVLTYLTWGYPIPQLHVLTGPVHEIKVAGFVDVRLDDVGEWGEEEPGAFMAKDGIEELMLRTCTAGNVTLSWNSDKVGLYTNPACEEQHKVDEDAGSVEGSRRATFSPDGTYTDDWETLFRTKTLWAKGAAPSAVGGDIQLALSPVTGEAPPDVVNLAVFEVVIDTPADTPGADPAFVCKWGKLQLGCTVRPWEARGGTYEWTKVTGPGTVTFTPAEIVGNPEFSANDVGMYAVKVEYTLSGGTCSDTKQIVVWRMRFDFVPPPETHFTIEGYPADGSGPIFGLLGTEWGDKVYDQGDQSFTDKAASLRSQMWTDGEGYAAKYGAESHLNPSGEHKYLVWLDVGGATVNVKVSAAWSATAGVGPVSTDITGGASARVSIGDSPQGYFNVAIVGGEQQATSTGPNPDYWTGTANGSVPVGNIEAGISYIDEGGDPGWAAVFLDVVFDVQRN